MKRIYKQALLIATLFFTFALPAHKARAQDDAYVSYNDFYQDLAPYGQWIQDPQYGYVWSPNVDASFRPYYTNGYWVMTNYGNTWVSNYQWGWAAFHYGRWTYDAYYGWLWIPGSDWGPAWVCWRGGGGDFGWAPLGPGYDLASGYDYNCPSDWWVFVPPQYIYGGGYYRYWYGPRGNKEIINNTTIINNTYTTNNTTFVSGPRANTIEEITHKPVQVYSIANSTSLSTRVHNNTVKMYRPAQVRPVVTNAGGQRVSPPNVITVTQPINNRPQAVNGTQGRTPGFKSAGPHNTVPADAVGTNYNEPEKAPVKTRTETRPYEWDVNKPMPQPQNRENTQEYHAPQPSAPAPQPMQQQRPAPQPTYRPAPQPQQARPAAPQPQGRR